MGRKNQAYQNLSEDAKKRLRAKIRSKQDYAYWVQNHAVIELDNGQVMSIGQAGGLHRGQRKVAAVRHHSLNVWGDKFCGIDCLKSRQQGVTTEEQAYQYFCVKKDSHSGAVIAHDTDTAEYIFEKFSRYHREDQFDPPSFDLESTRRFVSKNGGRYEVKTARSPESLRSRSLQNIHQSEAAYYGENGVKLSNAVSQMRGLRYCLNETTANGEDPFFHPHWQKSSNHCKLVFHEDPDMPFGFRVERNIVNPDRWNGYYPVFLSVLEDDRAHGEVADHEVAHIRDTLDEEEDWLIREIEAPWSFLKWRREVIAVHCSGDVEIFHQEYPVTAEQAFIVSGSPRFNHNILNQMPIEEGTRGFLTKQPSWSQEVEFRSDPHADLLVFERPKPGHRYVMAIDVSEGLDFDKGGCEFCGGDRDQSSVQVFDMDSPEGIKQVALLAGPLDEEELTDPTLLMGEFYNMAYVVIERVGGYGYHLVTEFQKRYPIDRLFRDTDKKAGLVVHHGNRTRLLNTLASYVNNRQIVLKSERTVHQMKQVKRTGGGRYEASTGHHDDDVSALWGIATAVENYPEYLLPQEQNRGILRKREQEWKREQGYQNPDPQGFY